MEKKNNKHIRWFRIAIAAIIVLALIVVPILLYLQYSKQKSDVVAIVNGEPITEMELNSYYDFLFFIRGYPESFKGLVSKQTVLTQLVNERVLLQEAKKSGIEVSASEVDTIIASVKKENSFSDADLEQILMQNNITIDQLKSYYNDVIKIGMLLNNTINLSVNVSDEAAEDYYINFTDEFAVPKRFTVQHILIMASKNTTDNETLAKAIKIYRMVNDTNFGQLAAEYSDDASTKAEGGILTFSAGQTVPEFENTTFSLIVGQVSEPVRSAYGYHIIKLLNVSPEKVQQYGDVKEEIKAKIQQLQIADLYKAYVAELLNQSKIEIFYNETLPASAIAQK